MSRWFRVYDDLVDDPKVQRLLPPQFKALINLWCLTSQNGGLLPSNEAIEFKLRMSPTKVQALLVGLHEAGLLEEDETGRHPHNWNGRQFKSDVSNERVKRHRNGRRNVTQAVTETPPETETETETETEQIQKESSAETVTEVPPVHIPSPPKKKNSEPKRVLRSMPEDFVLSESNIADAIATGWTRDHALSEGPRFRDHGLATGKRYRDIDAAWRNWVTSPYQNSAPNGKANGNGQAKRSGSVLDAIDRIQERLQSDDGIERRPDDLFRLPPR